MANFSIWMLEESNITVSGGKSLGGISQGDGTHLVGETLRLNARDWLETFVRDNGSDSNFDDNDNSQRLDGNQTIDGVDYNEGARVEAEYRLTVRDPDGNTYDLLGYNVNEPGQSPSYGTVEGLVFVDGFPPIGVDLEVVEAFEGPGDFGQAAVGSGDLASPPCFTPGTLILTDRGYVAVEDLRVGDAVRTRDAGVQRLAGWARWRCLPPICATAPSFSRCASGQMPWARVGPRATCWSRHSTESSCGTGWRSCISASPRF